MAQLPTVTQQQRSKNQGVKLQVWGPPKIGKTSLILTLNPERSLFFDIERGMKSVKGWPGKSVEPNSWEEIKNLTCFISGPDAGVFLNNDYGVNHYNHCCGIYGDPRQLLNYDTIFIDSTTVTGQLALKWCEAQPESWTKKKERDTRGMYGLLSRELTAWAWRLQKTPRLNIILTGGIKQDDAGQWVPMVDGGAALKFPYIFDAVTTMAYIPVAGGPPQRGIVCQSPNQWNYPAGARAPTLAPIEYPNLDAILKKFN